MPDEIKVEPRKNANITPPSQATWWVTIPGCELGRLRVKGMTEEDAVVAYRSITKMIGGRPKVEPAS